MKSELFRQRLDADPNNILFRFSLGQALYEEGRYAEASDQLAVCIDRREDWMVAEILLGKSLLAEGNTDAARKHFSHALDLARAQHHEGPEEELVKLLEGLT